MVAPTKGHEKIIFTPSPFRNGPFAIPKRTAEREDDRETGGRQQRWGASGNDACQHGAEGVTMHTGGILCQVMPDLPDEPLRGHGRRGSGRR